MSARRDGDARAGGRRTARNQTIAAFVVIVAVAFATGWWLALEHQKFSGASVRGPQRIAPPVAVHTPAPPRARPAVKELTAQCGPPA